MQTKNWTAALVALLSITSACNGGNAAPQPDGPLNAGVIAGNNQVVTATGGITPLPDKVVAQVIRLPNGQVGLRTWIKGALLPPDLYAQTQVQGVPNQPVCQTAKRPGELSLTADVPCAMSDATGKAYLTFLRDSIAGTPKARVGVSTASGTQITDSVSATILPGTADSSYRTGPVPIVPLPSTIPAATVIDRYGNAVPFRIVSDGRIALQDTTTGSVGARTIVSGPNDNIDHIVELRGTGNALVGHGRYNIGADGKLNNFMAAGVARQP